MASIQCRPEHPDPQCERKLWKNLNGEWEFEIDRGKSGFDRRLYESDALVGSIQVPFCPESRLSGVEDKDFMACVWYRRSFGVPAEWLADGRRIMLHFGACDYETHVYVNRQQVGTHIGGFASFQFDITDYVTVGENILTVAAVDDTRNPLQPTGKQSREYTSRRCCYTRTTGIWQTVWLEVCERQYISGFRFYPNAAEGRLTVEGTTVGGGRVTVETFFEGRPTGEASCVTYTGHFELGITLTEQHLWDLGEGNLYDVKLTFEKDVVSSYFGLRDIAFDGLKFLLNGRSVFQRLVLDQGFYPDGIYTAPSEEDLVRDIKLSMDAGFNGARLHQKVFEPRFLYHCDRLGYMTWGEYGDWGVDFSEGVILVNFLPEWLEILKRDFNHPSIVGWCPFNETWLYDGWKRGNKGLFAAVYQATKAFDSTRPCIDTSGGYHVITDVYDHHDYEQNAEKFKARYDAFDRDGTLELPPRFMSNQKYGGQPLFISEYGGIGWSFTGKGWGYRDVDNAEDFHKGYRGLTDALLDNASIFGFCYTQLYDVEQEENGLYFYDRRPKADIALIREINTRKAAIED